jgi:hypothetical protein
MEESRVDPERGLLHDRCSPRSCISEENDLIIVTVHHLGFSGLFMTFPFPLAHHCLNIYKLQIP